MAELIRAAVRTVYVTPPPDRTAIVQDILKMNLPSTDWKKVRKEIEVGHAATANGGETCPPCWS